MTNNDFLHVMHYDLGASANVRERDSDMSIKTSWSNESPSWP
jgi:hypothetical protein